METEKLIYKLFGYSREDILEKLAALGESIEAEVEEKYLDAKITLTCRGSDAHRMGVMVGNVFYGAIYADEDVSLAKCIIDRLAFYGRSLSVAESLTGGLVTDRLVSVPGCSEVLIEGLVTYSNASKAARLGVDPKAISKFGAVSAEVARQMATGLVKAGADIAVSTTGIAGPSGGSEEKPVGLTYIGIADEMKVTANELLFKGDREEVRNQAANTALFLLWKRIVKPNDFENMVIE
ncbi:MAG: CinA family protein [Clostridia bacterium]|nr:CinA family protein [Clostridia bacterium]